MKIKLNDFDQLGAILIAMDAVTEGQLQNILLEQDKDKIRLGELLIARNIITTEQLDTAVALQQKIRGKNKYEQSIASADLAIKRCNSRSSAEKRKIVKQQVDKISDEFLPVKKS